MLDLRTKEYTMLNIPKKKLIAARWMRNIGLAVMISLLIIWIFVDNGLIMLIALLGAAAAVTGEQWIRNLYSCPVCSKKLLPHRYMGKLEEQCPKFCPECGKAINVNIE